jgi:hypothetical protein
LSAPGPIVKITAPFAKLLRNVSIQEMVFAPASDWIDCPLNHCRPGSRLPKRGDVGIEVTDFCYPNHIA